VEKVLTGIRVLDFSRWFAGPYAATLLAAMGADVIRVERPTGEEERNFGPFAPNGESMLTMVTLANRRGVTLDPLSEKGQEVVHQLVKKSDVVLHSYVSGSREESLLDYEALKKINPAIIVAQVSGFGSWGPYKQRPCFDTITQALSGAMSYTGFPETAPTRSGYAWVDFSTGTHCALGIMFALFQRQKTGRGQYVDVALLDTAVACVAGLAVAAEAKVGGMIRERRQPHLEAFLPGHRPGGAEGRPQVQERPVTLREPACHPGHRQGLGEGQDHGGDHEDPGGRQGTLRQGEQHPGDGQ
jgi:crotonobetainyl-CoA:carnitine CoA-transferase CaiB-like acyl-CoA transferase